MAIKEKLNRIIHETPYIGLDKSSVFMAGWTAYNHTFDQAVKNYDLLFWQMQAVFFRDDGRERP
jgi:hypothetical protein